MILHPSPNFEERKTGVTPQLIILHGTWTDNFQETLDHLTDGNPDRPNGRVSAHYAIDEDGAVYKLVEEEKRAWHAGKSQWQNITDINSASIGIEIQNDGTAPYTFAQIDALISLLKDIMTRHAIPPENVLGHEDVAPGRKDDPGAHFPWKTLTLAGVAKKLV